VSGPVPGSESSAVRVRVPATSANLGPGFDTLGLALGLYDELSVHLADEGLVVSPYGDVPVDERNLVVRSLRTAFAATGGQPAGLRLTYTSRIPHARGLGSSSAAICAGVVAALALRGVAADDPLALQLAAQIEGHPDNVAPCLLGGATIAYYDADGAPHAVRFVPDTGIRPLVCVPGARTSTEAARSALPPVVPHADAAFNAGRAALLVSALSAHPDLLFSASEDRLHQPFRLPAVPASRDLFEHLRHSGIAAVLSGSGPTVLALCATNDEAATVRQLAADSTSTFDVLEPGVDLDGAVVLAGGD
jgi:homoserine kinase